MLEFRKDAEAVIRRVQKGQRLVLTYRGKAVARLEPIQDRLVNSDDPFYRLCSLADDRGESLTDREMDEIIYAP
jgi:antitoxin (DNA-binding transcriptional repressor) of toxin-antitoxin stability system